MTLWILRRGTSGREYRRRMTLRAEVEKPLNQRPQHHHETSSLALSDSSFAEDPEWYIRFINMQQTPNQRPRYQSFSGLSRESCANRYLCNNKANLLTWLVTCCQKILGTRPKMTGTRDVSLVLPVSLLLLLSGRGNNLPIFPKNSENTFAAAKKVPLFRDIGFAERERETFCLLIFHLSFLVF